MQQAYGLSLPEAAALLEGECLPTISRSPDPARSAGPERDTAQEAASIWRSAGPIDGTPAEAYLRSRGLRLELPSTLRFARLRCGSHGTFACLVALVTTPQNKIGGIQRTFVREDGSGKADVPTPKLSLGRINGGAIRLAPAGHELLVTGGIEDGLTLQQELHRPTWAAMGEGNMANMVLPDIALSVTIGADRDESGERHARRAADAFSTLGREVRIMRPSLGFKDFNDELRGVSA